MEEVNRIDGEAERNLLKSWTKPIEKANRTDGNTEQN